MWNPSALKVSSWGALHLSGWSPGALLNVNVMLLIRNNNKREAALKNEAGGDEKRVFFTWPDIQFLPCTLPLQFLMCCYFPK